MPSERLRSISGDMVGQEGTGLGKALADLAEHETPLMGAREEPLYKETKGEEVGKAADEVIVPAMGMEHNMPGGKDLC